MKKNHRTIIIDDDGFIETDDRQYILKYKKRTRKETIKIIERFFPTFTQALKYYIELKTGEEKIVTSLYPALKSLMERDEKYSELIDKEREELKKLREVKEEILAEIHSKKERERKRKISHEKSATVED